MKRALIVIFLLAVAVAGSVLSRLNFAPVSFNYYFGSLDLSLALLLLLVFSCGALVGLLLTIVLLFSARRKQRHLSRKLALCEQEIRNLRDIPIKGRH